jgi:hypothetical protein
VADGDAAAVGTAADVGVGLDRDDEPLSVAVDVENVEAVQAQEEIGAWTPPVATTARTVRHVELFSSSDCSVAPDPEDLVVVPAATPRQPAPAHPRLDPKSPLSKFSQHRGARQRIQFLHDAND